MESHSTSRSDYLFLNSSSFFHTEIPPENSHSLSNLHRFTNNHKPPARQFPKITMSGNYDPEALAGCFSFCLGVWIITGSLAYSDRLKSLDSERQNIVLGGLSLVYLIFFISSLINCSYHPTLSAGYLLTAAVLGVSTAGAYFIITPGRPNRFYTAFCLISGSLAACWLEVTMGFVRTSEHWLGAH